MRAPVIPDNTVIFTDYATGNAVRLGQWSTSVDSYGRANATIAHQYLDTLQSSDIDRLEREARALIRAYLLERGQLGKGYRLKLAYQITRGSRDITTVAFFEA